MARNSKIDKDKRTSELQTLIRAVKDGSNENFYIFYGEETYLRDYYLQRLKETVLGNGMETFNYHSFTDKTFSLDDFDNAVNSFPLMSNKTFISVFDFDLFKNNLSNDDKERLYEILQSIPEYCCVVFIFDTIPYSKGSNTKIGKLINQYAHEIEFTHQDQRKLVNWIKKRFSASGKEIDDKLAEYLIMRCGDLMNVLINEIGKIAAYAKSVKVTQEDIDAVTEPQLSAVIFTLLNAVSENHPQKIMEILNELFLMKEPLQKILILLGKQLNDLYTAKLASAENITPLELAKILKKNERAASALLYRTSKLSLSWCRNAVYRFSKLQYEMKRTGTGDDQETLIVFLLSLSTSEKK